MRGVAVLRGIIQYISTSLAAHSEDQTFAPVAFDLMTKNGEILAIKHECAVTRELKEMVVDDVTQRACESRCNFVLLELLHEVREQVSILREFHRDLGLRKPSHTTERFGVFAKQALPGTRT